MKKIFIIIIALLALGAGGFFGYKTLSASKNGNEIVTVDYDKAVENQIVMETITTNLNKDNHFIVVSFTVQADSKNSKEEFEKRLAEMKSLSIHTFNSLSKSELIAEKGSHKVVDALLDVYNQHLTSGTVTNVFLTDFKIQ